MIVQFENGYSNKMEILDYPFLYNISWMGACDSKDSCRPRKEEEASVEYNQLKYTQNTINEKANSRTKIGKACTLTDVNMEIPRNGR